MKTEDRDLKYVWLDLETTGSNEIEDVILELGVVITDAELTELDRASWVLNDDGCLQAAPDVVKEMHAINGLAYELADGMTAAEVETEFVALLKRHGKKHDFVLAGSGVSHFDRRFLQAEMPKALKWFRYYSIDVGILRRTLRMIGREDLSLPFDQEDKKHRALDDALLHLEELRYVKKALAQ